MDTLQSTPPVQVSGKNGAWGRKKFLVFFSVLLTLVVLVAAGSFAWASYWSPEARRAQEAKANFEKFNAGMQAYEDAMRADTYGGATPEETLRMFIDALKKNDIELASKYFMLETNTQSQDYLTRKKWEDGLAEAQKNDKLQKIMTIVENEATSTRRNLGSSDIFEFVVLKRL